MFGSDMPIERVKGYLLPCINLCHALAIVGAVETTFGNVTDPPGDVASFITDNYPFESNDPIAVVEQFQDGDGATLADGTTDFTHVSFPDGKRYVEPIELILKKAGITSSFVTFVEDGMGQILVSDSDAATTISKLATVGISATVMER